RRTGVGTAQSHIEEKAAGVTAIIDPVREMAPDRVRCGPGSESLGFSTRRRAPSSLRLRRLPARTYWPVDGGLPPPPHENAEIMGVRNCPFVPKTKVLVPRPG